MEIDIKDVRRLIIRLRRDTYQQWKTNNPVLDDGELVAVTKLPWYKSWLGIKPTRLKLGDGITEFNKLKWL